MHTDTRGPASFLVLAATSDVPTDHILDPVASASQRSASRFRRPLVLLLLFGGALLLLLLFEGARLALVSDLYDGY